MRLAATFNHAKAEAVLGRVDYRSVNQVRASVVLGHAAGENGDTLPGRNEFELFLDCGGASDWGVQRRMGSEVSQDELSLRGQRVIGGQVGNGGFGANGLRREAGGVEGLAKVAHVSAAVAQRFRLFVPVEPKHLDLDSLVFSRIAPDRRGHTEPRRKTHHQARAAAGGLVDAPGSCSGPGEYVDGFVLQLSSGLGEPHSAGCALQQYAAELLFERADLSTKHGLGDVQVLGRAPEVLVLSYGCEVTKLAQVQIHASKVSVCRRQPGACRRAIYACRVLVRRRKYWTVPITQSIVGRVINHLERTIP
jgi:hypothetical protein